jgi:hypothetical protein
VYECPPDTASPGVDPTVRGFEAYSRATSRSRSVLTRRVWYRRGAVSDEGAGTAVVAFAGHFMIAAAPRGAVL